MHSISSLHTIVVTVLLAMDHFKAQKFHVRLYDKGTTIREIASEMIKVNTNPTREDADDPFFIFDIGDVISKDDQWRKLLPSVDTFYAVKANPDPWMVKLIVGLGRGFDCASKNELKLVLAAGASPDNIIYANTQKQETHLRFAKEKGVRLMTFDTEEELYKVKRVYPQAKLVLRVAFSDVTAGYQLLATKFGCSEKEWRPLLDLAKKLDLDVVGISFHAGCEVGNPQVYDWAIQYIRPMFDFGRAAGFTMNLLDLGGGFPGKIQPTVSFKELADVIKQSLELNFPSSFGVRVIAEPGTFYTRSAEYLVANVISKRVCKVPDGDNNEEESTIKLMYYLNVGLFNSLLTLMYLPGYFDPPMLLKEPGDAELKLSCIWGPTCDSIDVIFARCKMPEMDAGDFVIFFDLGGYASTMACEFNGFKVPPTSYIAPKESRAILERIFSTEKNGNNIADGLV